MSLSKYPLIPLQDIVQINPRPDTSSLPPDFEVSFVPMKAVETLTGVIDTSDIRKLESVSKGFTPFKERDILFAKITPCMENGKIAIAKELKNGIGYGSTEFFVFRCGNKILPEYLYHFLIQDSFRRDAQRNMAGAVGQQRVTRKWLENVNIPLPTLDQQLSVINRLEELTSELENAKISIEIADQKLKQYKELVLREILNNPPQVREVTLDSVSLAITDGDHQAPPRASDGVPFIVISNIKNHSIELKDVTRYVPYNYFRDLKTTRKPAIGDVLFTVTGSYGIPAMVLQPEDFCFQRHIALIRPDESKILQKFLFYSLLLPDTKRQADRIATGTAQLTVPLNGLRKIKLKLPPLEIQNKLIDRIDSMFSEIDNTARITNSLKTQEGNLRQTAYQLYFTK